MTDSPRQRVDLTRLSPVLRYGLALAVVAVVVVLVIIVSPSDARPTAWYPVVVTVGAVVLLVVGAAWLLRRLVRAVSKSPKG